SAPVRGLPTPPVQRSGDENFYEFAYELRHFLLAFRRPLRDPVAPAYRVPGDVRVSCRRDRLRLLGRLSPTPEPDAAPGCLMLAAPGWRALIRARPCVAPPP